MSQAGKYPKLSQFRQPQRLVERLRELGLELPIDARILTAAEGSPLAEPVMIGGFRVGNRWCIQPMEGWDARPDGAPSELVERRWRRFGRSGAKLIWGEATAVTAAGRANPRQLLASTGNQSLLANLLEQLRQAHRQRVGNDGDLLVGLQLTHSGRFARSDDDRPQPRIAYHHPLLDGRVGLSADDDHSLWSDDELARLIDQYVFAAGVARGAGFQFVDIKACHGYTLHEFLSAHTRPGPFGGDFDGRTRLLRTIVARVRDAYPDLLLGVRLSVFDTPPFEATEPAMKHLSARGLLPYRYGFGLDADHPDQMELSEPIRLIRELAGMGVALINVSAGSPYYNPHVQRPAIFPPSDGYPPPEDPLVGVWRQIVAARDCQHAAPELPMVGSGYSYLQEFLPLVAQAVVRQRWIACVGIGRMALAYPDLPIDCLQAGHLARKQICRTFSDCTTGPRQGLVSGCYPLDLFYRASPEARLVQQAKRDLRPPAAEDETTQDG